MSDPLVDLEDYGKTFFVTEREHPDPLLRMKLRDLTTSEGAAAFVRAYAPEIKAPSKDVSATYFASWAGRLCAAFQYALWHDHAELDLSLDNLDLELVRTAKGAALSFHIKELRGNRLPGEENQWSEAAGEALTRFYGTQIRPLVESIAQAGGVPAGSLWALMATTTHYIWDQWKLQVEDPEEMRKIKLLAEWLIHTMEPAVIGQSRNPFGKKFRFVESFKQPGTKVRVKGSCCLAYKTDTGHGYCHTCPRITEKERKQLMLLR